MSVPEPVQSASHDPGNQPSSLEEAARVARALRIEAMLDRWKAEDCADEPDWEVETIAPLRVGANMAGAERDAEP